MTQYSNPGPTVEEIESQKGICLLEFGTDWCGYCKALAPFIEDALAPFPEGIHIKVEDGKGRRLGRMFQVKLWPTVIVLKDGKEQARFVRPQSSKEIQEVLRNVY